MAEREIVRASDVIHRGIGERKIKGFYNKGGAGKKKAKSKKKLRFPPVGGWIGGSPDRNGLKLADTYSVNSPMKKSQCHKKGKV